MYRVKNLYSPGHKRSGFFIMENEVYIQGYEGSFHQAAAMVSPNTADANQKALQRNISVIPDRYALPTALAQKEFAENAALLSIEKIKKRSAPALTIEEMKQVRVNKILTPIQKN